MKITPSNSKPQQIYSLMIRAINPRPIAWVSTCSPQGISNLAPFSYFNGVGSQPAALMFSIVNLPDGGQKDTLVNIESNGEFVVNIVPHSLADPMAQTATPYDYEVSEFEQAGLTALASDCVKAPRVGESPIQFECRVIEVVRVGDGPLAANVVIGEIVCVHVDEGVLDTNGKIDPNRLDTIGRMGGRDYCRTTERFQANV